MRDYDFELTMICIVTIILLIVLNIHWADTRNLQRRVGQLEQQVNR